MQAIPILGSFVALQQEAVIQEPGVLLYETPSDRKFLFLDSDYRGLRVHKRIPFLLRVAESKQ